MDKYYKEFDDYVSNYDLTDKKIKLKYNHSYRVMALSKKYAKKLNFSKEDQELATIIGLLHDIGRFEQVRLYNTFNDSISIDHADLGVKILFEDGLITKFWDNEDDYEIIKFAIQNHNKFKIEETDDEKKIMHAKLIRDTDKTDIIYVEGKLDEEHLRAINKKISDNIQQTIFNHNQILKKDLNNLNDHLALFFSFVFDINNDIILPELKKNYKWYYERIDGKDIFKEIYSEINKYIDERIEKNVRN